MTIKSLTANIGHRAGWRWLLLALLLVVLALNSALPAQAFPAAPANAHINGTDCDLIDAIIAANTDTASGDCAAGTPGADTIELLDNVTLTAVIYSDTGLPQITSEITINGNGFTIARDAGAADFRILWVDGSGSLTLNDTTVSGGYFADTSGPVGGGIISFGTLTLNNSTVSNNKAASNGGGIASNGTLTLNNSTVSGNSGGTLSSGGGISTSGTATITNSTISGNTNIFGGGISNSGVLTISDSTISDNNAETGGGIYTGAGAISTLEHTLVAGNDASTGSEIYNDPEFCDKGCFPAGVTNADNFNLFGHNGLSSAQAFSNFTPGGSDINATSDGTTPTALSSILGTTLQNNGGNTETHALLAGSPAVDAAPSGPAADQRGVSRPQGCAFDIGAYELEPAPCVTNNPPTVAADNANVTVDEGQLATNTGTLSDPDGDVVSLNASVGVIDHDNSTWIWVFLSSDSVENLPVTITADDGNGGTAETTFILNVNNVAPTADAGPDQTVYRNETVTVSGTWSDPAGAADNPYTWSWDLDGDAIADDSGSASYGDSIVRTTSFAVDGVATLFFSVADKDGAVFSDTVDITVINRAPVADNQSLNTDEDTALPITLTASDADGDSLTYSVLTLPGNGTLSGTAPNLSYTPNPDYFGSDSFTFQVNDGLADSNIATVSIGVYSVNDPAVAADDTATTAEDTPVTIDVQANDSAGPANEDPALTTSAVTAPAHGSAAINPDGSITYTPANNFNGADSFDYTVCDSDSACDAATVTVLVEMVNDPPAANDDSVTTAEDTPVTFNVLDNDDDVDGNLDAGSVSLVTSPANGSLTDNGSGSFTYSPNANFNGSDSFNYQVCDTDHVCDDAVVSITITSVNDAPVCGDVTPSVSTLWPPNHQFEPVTVSGVTDIEGDAITISISSIFQDEPTNGTGDGDTSPDGQGLGSSTAEVRAERQGGGNGRYYHIGFSASDGNGGSCTGTVKVSVPKNQGKKGAAVDDGPLYDSTQP